jgi:hypothetical protein
MRQKFQIALVIVLIAVTIRTGYILYQRHEANKPVAPKQETLLPADYYVVPKSLHATDLASARHITDQPVWVKVGYSSTYYPYDAATHRVNFAREAGLLLPIEQLKVTSVITDAAPNSGGKKQVLAVFTKDGKNYAVPIGAGQGRDYTMYANDMFYIEDPHQLYKYWPADIWDSIEKHEVKPGMNELQTDFAIGLGVPDSSGESYTKSVTYGNGGKPLIVTFAGGKATEVKPGQ